MSKKKYYENEVKKDMIDYIDKKKIAFKELEMNMFAQKQKIMQDTTKELWKLKHNFMERQNDLQTNKMFLYHKLKTGTITDEEFKQQIKEIKK